MPSAYTAGSPSPNSAPAGSLTLAKIRLPVAAARIPMAGSGSTLIPPESLTRPRTAPGPWPSSSAATRNSSPSAARGTSVLVPSSVYPSPVRRAPGLEYEGVEHGRGSSTAAAAAADRLAHHLRQVGGLLITVAPQTQGGGHPGGSQAGQGDSHVSLGQRLAHEHGGTADRCSTAPPSSSGTPTIVRPSSLDWASSSTGQRRRRRRHGRPAAAWPGRTP